MATKKTKDPYAKSDQMLADYKAKYGWGTTPATPASTPASSSKAYAVGTDISGGTKMSDGTVVPKSTPSYGFGPVTPAQKIAAAPTANELAVQSVTSSSKSSSSGSSREVLPASTQLSTQGQPVQPGNDLARTDISAWDKYLILAGLKPNSLERQRAAEAVNPVTVDPEAPYGRFEDGTPIKQSETGMASVITSDDLQTAVGLTQGAVGLAKSAYNIAAKEMLKQFYKQEAVASLRTVTAQVDDLARVGAQATTNEGRTLLANNGKDALGFVEEEAVKSVGKVATNPVTKKSFTKAFTDYMTSKGHGSFALGLIITGGSLSVFGIGATYVVSAVKASNTGATTTTDKASNFCLATKDASVNLEKAGDYNGIRYLNSLCEQGLAAAADVSAWDVFGTQKNVANEAINELERNLRDVIITNDKVLAQQAEAAKNLEAAQAEQEKAQAAAQAVETKAQADALKREQELSDLADKRAYDESRLADERAYKEQQTNEQRAYNEQQAALAAQQAGFEAATATEASGGSSLNFGLLNSGGDIEFVNRDAASQAYFGKVYEELTPAQKKLLMLSKGMK